MISGKGYFVIRKGFLRGLGCQMFALLSVDVNSLQRHSATGFSVPFWL